MTILVAGMDEVATEPQLVSGWTYFVLTDADRIRYEAAVSRLNAAGAPRHYHAKKFKKARASEYEAFLRVLRDALENATEFSALMGSMYLAHVGYIKRC
jgi:hypothetical protein